MKREIGYFVTMQRIILIGFMGSGKTTLGGQLAQILGIPFFDSDELIEQKMGIAVNQIFAAQGEQAFREMETEVITDLCEISEFVLAVGGGLPAISGMMQRLNELGKTVFLNVSRKELLRRLVMDRSKRPLLKDKSELELKEYFNRLHDLREPYYIQAQIHIQQDDLTAQELIEAINLRQKN